MNDGYLHILNSIASSEPTPGGGSVAALSLAHAHSLAAMVSRLTLKSEKWSQGHSIANSIVDESENHIAASISLAESDAAAFDAVMDAYRLPKDQADSTMRAEAIREATIGAAIVPLQTVHASRDLLEKLLVLSKVCNANALTDLAAAGELAHSAAKIAEMNVKINTHYISGNDVEQIDEDARLSIIECNRLVSNVRATCFERLGW